MKAMKRRSKIYLNFYREFPDGESGKGSLFEYISEQHSER